MDGARMSKEAVLEGKSRDPCLQQITRDADGADGNAPAVTDDVRAAAGSRGLDACFESSQEKNACVDLVTADACSESVDQSWSDGQSASSELE